ncbi:MAG TPA: phytanoyl-CoA dioxygenase family protein [Planctomycetota bacterium]
MAVRTLADTDRLALDVRGFVVLRKVVDAGELAALRADFDQADAARAPYSELVKHPLLQACVQHVLQRPFRLLEFGRRDPRPGGGLQGLHMDWPPRPAGRPFVSVTALVALDAFLADNGPPRLLPGSHMHPKPLAKSLQKPQARHPDEQRVLAAAGDALILNAHVWHSGTRNDTGARRRALQLQYVALDAAPPAP